MSRVHSLKICCSLLVVWDGDNEVLEEALIYLSDSFIHLKCSEYVTCARPDPKCWGYREVFWKSLNELTSAEVTE